MSRRKEKKPKMPRRPKQQTLVTAPGEDPSQHAGTKEAKAKMARVRAAKRPSQPTIERAVQMMSNLQDMARLFKVGGLGRDLTEVQLTILLVRGMELGIGPTESVQGLYWTPEGKIEMQAELCRALVGRSGRGLLVPKTLSNEECVLQAIRYGDGDRPDYLGEHRYTLADAQRAGLIDESWRKYPRAMLLARCSTEAVRAVFPDVILGAYAPGEVRGETHVEEHPVDMPPVTPPVTPPPAAPADALRDLQPPPEAQEPDQPAPEAPEPPGEVEPEAEPEVEPEEEPASEPTAKGADAASEGNGLDQSAPSSPISAEPPAAVTPLPPAGPPAMVHYFEHLGPDGKVTVVKTAGITKPQLKRLGDLTTDRAGQPNFQELKGLARKWLEARQRPWLASNQPVELRYMNEAEGAELILLLESQAAEPALTSGSEQEQLLNAVLTETATTHLKDKVILLLTKSRGVDMIEQIPMPELRQLLAQARSVITDPQVFGVMLERTMAAAAGGPA